jgi:hypothetical protein
MAPFGEFSGDVSRHRHEHLQRPIANQNRGRRDYLRAHGREENQPNRDQVAEAEHHQHAVGKLHLLWIPREQLAGYPPAEENHAGETQQRVADDMRGRITAGPTRLD